MDDYEPTARRAAAGRDALGEHGSKYGDPARRETNTMPQWAGSCWYYLRFIDPKNDEELVETANDATGCRSTSMLAVTSMPCCICFTRGSGTRCCSISALFHKEPFQKLVNQGMILGSHWYRNAGKYHYPDTRVEKRGTVARRENPAWSPNTKSRR